MESINIIPKSETSIIKDEIKYSALITNLEYNSKSNLLAVGDQNGRISLFDLRTNKAVKLIKNTKEKIDVKYFFNFIYIHIKFSLDGTALYFSQGLSNIINYCDLKNDKLIFNEKDVKSLIIINSGENMNESTFNDAYNLKINEIIDFSISPNEDIILFNDQDNDRFLFLDLKSDSLSNSNISNLSIVDNFALSSAFTQIFTRKDECILCSFEGEFIKYNYKEKKIKSEKNVKNYLTNELKSAKFNNYLTNPPYINKCIYNPFREEIYLGLLNGVILNLKNNLKTNYVKLIHNAMVRDMKVYNKDGLGGGFLITLGRDKNIKLIDLEEGEIKLNIDLNEYINEDPCLIESDDLGSIYYADAKNNNLKIINFK